MVLSWDRQQRPNGEVWSIQQLFQESLDRSDLFVPRARTTIAQTRSFAIIGPSLWNALPFTLRETFLSGSLSSSLSLLKTYFFSRGSRTGSATEWPRL